ncbi:chromate transporter [Pseudorhodoplanes sp.]|uniref:chromate transporter n=1 Tax=Pseudorhodoplanes sp. TaxID=1934341 RepID=UPI002CE1E63A|nr:chromate transporter [Pseudorhodoplanes sp.]HWV52704.1 chromate transporter [Pseudorhodoplanes sp.]
MKASDPLIVLASHFALLSLFAIGGANAAIPEMYRIAVQLEGWLTDQQFSDLFAIAQVTPGPNVIITTLIGYQVAGITGALVATAAMVGPTCIATYFITKVWDRFRDAPLRIAIQLGLVPVSIGLLAASAWIMALTTDSTWIAAGITVVSASVGYFSRLNPLWVFAIAAIMGAIGLI